MIDLGDIIDAEAISVSLERKTGGSYNDDGEWQGEVIAPETIRAVLQPATGRQLQDLPEGERTDARFFLWTRSALVSDDVIVYGGERYRIVFDWPRPEGGFTKAAIGKIG